MYTHIYIQICIHTYTKYSYNTKDTTHLQYIAPLPDTPPVAVHSPRAAPVGATAP